MITEKPNAVLKGKKALVIGIANEHSIAYGCAKAFRELGADLAVTYLNEKARPYVEPLARELEAPLFLPLDVGNEGALEGVFAAVAAQWGDLDILVHSIAFAPKEDLQGGSSTARRRALRRQWTCRATRSCVWHGSPRR
jgi:enoyl-[acyl-carrier protein] reductase I